MKRFALGIAAGAVAVFGGLATAYGALKTVWPESLPAPAISRLVQIDEKLRFLRRHPEIDPKILAVGSSITGVYPPDVSLNSRSMVRRSMVGRSMVGALLTPCTPTHRGLSL